MALLEVRTEWAVYKDCFLQVARYQADNSRARETSTATRSSPQWRIFTQRTVTTSWETTITT